MALVGLGIILRLPELPDFSVALAEMQVFTVTLQSQVGKRPGSQRV